MAWIGCLHCEKFRSHFVAWPSTLIAPVRHDLHIVSCSNEMFPNAPKHYETLRNMSLGCNGMDRVPLLRKIPTQVRGTNFCTSSTHFAPSFVRQPKGPECTQIIRNAPKRQFYCLMGWIWFVAKNSNTTSLHELLHYFGPLCTEFRKAIKRSRMHPNSMKRTKTSF